MIHRFILAQYQCPMAVTMFDNVFCSFADFGQLSSIKRHHQFAVYVLKVAMKDRNLIDNES